MKKTSIALSFLFALSAIAGCNESGSHRDDIECDENNPCTDTNKTCENNKCVDKKPECDENNPCADTNKTCENNKCVDKKPECDENNPCADSNKTCENNKCVEKKPECDENNPCADKSKTCENNKCVEKKAPDACTSNSDCTSEGTICHESKCVDAASVKCISDSQCGDGYICDEHCIPANACSISRTCPGTQVCRNGRCIEKPHVACDKETPCTNEDETCVAGTCVKCSCKADEFCQPDGSCASSTHSDLKNINVGDECDWKTDDSFCDGNRLFSCSKDYTEETTTFKVRNCGVNLCAESPTDGVNCYEPCPALDDLYGECLEQYNSMDGYYNYYAFKTKCTETPSGPVWTFTEGYETCAAGCANGSCIIVPDDYNQQCYKTTYPNRCSGDWNLWCENTSAQTSGYVVGENCSGDYSNDTDKFYCAMDEEGVSDCVTDCKTAGETRYFCHSTGLNYIYSDKRTCRESESGKLAFFLDEYTQCTKGCNESTGKCK